MSHIIHFMSFSQVYDEWTGKPAILNPRTRQEIDNTRKCQFQTWSWNYWLCKLLQLGYVPVCFQYGRKCIHCREAFLMLEIFCALVWKEILKPPPDGTVLCGFHIILLCAIPCKSATGSPSIGVCLARKGVWSQRGAADWWGVGIRDRRGRLRGMLSPLKIWHILFGDWLWNGRCWPAWPLCQRLSGCGYTQVCCSVGLKERCVQVGASWRGELWLSGESVRIWLERSQQLSSPWVDFANDVLLRQCLPLTSNHHD